MMSVPLLQFVLAALATSAAAFTGGARLRPATLRAASADDAHAARLYVLDDAGAWADGAAATAAVRFVDREQAMCLVVDRDGAAAAAAGGGGAAPLRSRVQPVEAYELDEATSSIRWSEPAAAGRWHALSFDERGGFAAVAGRIAALAAGAPPAAPAATPAQQMRRRLNAQRKARGEGRRRARVTPGTPEELELARRGEWNYYPEDDPEDAS